MLEPIPGGTRATVRLSWCSPAGALGKGDALSTGNGPEASLEDDLQRMKQVIERGLPPREGEASVTGSRRENILH